MNIIKNKNSLVKRLAWCSLAGQAGFFGLTVLLHFLRPDYDPLSRFISEYVIGSYSPLMIIAFELLGSGSLALTVGLFLDEVYSNQTNKQFQMGTMALGLWSVSVVVVGLFPTNLKDEPFTLTSIIHGVASMLAFISIVTAAFLLTKGFKESAKWSPLYRPALFLSWAMLIALLAFFASPSDFKGITERGVVIIFILWLYLASLKLAQSQPKN